VSGQPNIYSLFMGIASQLLSENGGLIFITPRSFTSGNYFKAFRDYFFGSVQLERIHLFDSGKKHSTEIKSSGNIDNQDNKTKIDTNKTVLISSSSGIEDIINPAKKISVF
jgi:adenine-specific DNA-methyltransferase